MLERQKERLLAMRTELESQNKRFQGALKEAGTSRSVIDEVDGIQADESVDTFAAVAGLNDTKIKQINDALFAIRAGTYGQCEACRGEIHIERLAALPFARTCLACQEQAEAA